ncbi:hypothetical protein [Pseudoalteromonas marina]|uniref:Uncharacterized protein n=1 Tax=Pseudoalteromonas marina TaxID=267375 RepID=A0ABT9FGF9_9GAMM|nr:hypothetical protein [Pseudoalteromonas marina]MDP2565769.1 hypothetical protein [Pseudoalteromonas marina]
MKSLYEATQLIKKFGTADDFCGVKKLYKKGALLCHTDRENSSTEVSIVELNLAWEIICKDKDAAVTLISDKEAPCVFKSDKLHYSSMPSFYSRETMVNNCDSWIVCNQQNFAWNQVRANRQYVEDVFLEYFKIYGSDNFTITAIENALKHNKTCQRFSVSIHWKDRDKFSMAWFTCMRDLVKSEDIKDVWDWLNNLEFSEPNEYGECKSKIVIDGMELNILREDVRSNSQFSPFNLSHVKPITKAPKKWKRADLLKLVANGQFTHLKQTHYYSDGGGNAPLGYIKNPIKLFDEFLGERSFNCWASTSNDGEVKIHFGFHSNDGRSLMVNLNNRYPLVDMKEEEETYLSNTLKQIA